MSKTLTSQLYRAARDTANIRSMRSPKTFAARQVRRRVIRQEFKLPASPATGGSDDRPHNGLQPVRCPNFGGL